LLFRIQLVPLRRDHRNDTPEETRRMRDELLRENDALKYERFAAHTQVGGCTSQIQFDP
jgi:hypothetical protein